MLNFDLSALRSILPVLQGLSVEEKWALAIVALPVASLLFGLIAWLFRKLGREYEQKHGLVPQLKIQLENSRHETLRLESRNRPLLEELNSKQEEIDALRFSGAKLPEDIERLIAIQSKVADDDFEVWSLRERQRPARLKERLESSGTKIITVGNLKGGVGKTTLTSNLAAYFDKKCNLDVLLIDLDFQGSLSATTLKAANQEIGNSLSEHLLSGELNGKKILRLARNLDTVLEKTKLIPASISLQAMEEKLMMRWVFFASDADIRFNLAQSLLSKEVQENFDIVLLDVGPRLTTASVSALMASTHLIVPTNLDRMSVETVETMLSRAGKLKQDYNLAIEVAGIVGTMTFRQNLTNSELDAKNSLDEVLKDWSSGARVFDCSIPRKQALAKIAGEGIGYLLPAKEGGTEIRKMVDSLGEEITKRIGL